MKYVDDYEAHIFKAPEVEEIVKQARDFFSQTPLSTFPPKGKFNGGGVYGLYYIGDYAPYGPITKQNRKSFTKPIYIGKAVLPGNRTGQGGNQVSLLARLRQHSNSIKLAEKETGNIRVEDFRCRYMFLNGIEHDLIGAVETYLIRSFSPLWNSRVVDGFGNHDPGKGRYEQQPSAWDTIHPGRKWVLKLTGQRRNPDAIKEQIARFLMAPQPSDLIESSEEDANEDEGNPKTEELENTEENEDPPFTQFSFFS